MNIKDFKVGDTVFVRDYNYRSEEDTAKMREAVVTKVGRSIVYVKYKDFPYGSDYRFANEPEREYYLTQKVDAGTQNKLFRSMSDCEDWIESEKLYRDIRGYFHTYYTDLTLDQLRRIKSVLEENEKE